MTISSIKLSWQPPAELNGIIEEYQIQYEYKDKTSLAVGINKKTINADMYPERLATLEHLNMNMVYNISVRERTSAQQLGAASWITAKTKGGGEISFQ